MKPSINYFANPKQYIEESKTIANSMYDKIVEQSKANRSVGVQWIQRTFHVSYYTAAFVIDRMEEEGVCEKYQGEGKHRRVLVAS